MAGKVTTTPTKYQPPPRTTYTDLGWIFAALSGPATLIAVWIYCAVTYGLLLGAHDAAAIQMEEGYGGLYALVWGEPVLPERSTAIWLTRPRGIQWRLVLDTVRQQFPQTTLWRRQMVLGPGKEFGLIAPPGVEIAAPSGWSALAIERVRVDGSL
jgi:hypothetical protein